MQSKCTECGNKNSRFVKKQEAKGLLSNLETPLSKIPIVECFVLSVWKWMKLFKKFYWRDIMPENRLKQSALLDKSDFTYSAFTKNKERIEIQTLFTKWAR